MRVRLSKKEVLRLKVLNRNEFLELKNPVLYVKCDQSGNTYGELSIKYPNPDLADDFVYVGLHSFIKEYGGDSSLSGEDGMGHLKLMNEVLRNREISFEWDYSMSGRDGLFDREQIFMIYEKLDLLKLIRELNKLYEHCYHKDDYNCKYEIY